MTSRARSFGVLPVDPLEEDGELIMAVAIHALAYDVPGCDVQRSKERGWAVRSSSFRLIRRLVLMRPVHHKSS